MYAFSSSPILPNNFFLTVYLLRENWIYRTRGFCYYYLFQVCYKKFLFRGWQTLILQLLTYRTTCFTFWILDYLDYLYENFGTKIHTRLCNVSILDGNLHYENKITCFDR